MQEASPLTPDPPGPGLRWAVPDDAVALARLDATCFAVRPYPSSLIRAHIERGSPCPVATGRDGLGIVAFAMVDIHRVTGDGLMLTLDVEPTHRRRGLGTALLGVCAREVVRAGGTTVVLTTASRNAPARALYDRLGFRPEGVIEGYYGDDDAVVMVHLEAAALAGLAPEGPPRRAL
jgi:ribosomal protein S18 acetylase RimI-like enzyme